LTNNIISLDDFRKQKTSIEDIEDEYPELEDPVVIGWVTDENGDRSIHVVSAVSTVSCLWMIDLAKEIVDSRPSEHMNENE
jgi:hypothetical protein|tara:strand:- start:224 stop:466 length:243 start_codon:yes stop_codon:yes gene_type:complete